MTQISKLKDRFLSIPADFTWNELVNLLTTFGYKELKAGKTGGSRRKFINQDDHLILLHKPHPSNNLKKYAIKQIIDNLKEKGTIKDE